MRISDWSSDVCSSDLASCQRAEPAERIDQQVEPRPADAVLLAILDSGDHGLVDAGLRLEDPLGPSERVAATLEDRQSLVWESVCQYVLLSVVSSSFQ